MTIPASSMAVFESLFVEVAVILGVASVVGALALWLRQPLIVAFITVGILVGPGAFGLVHSVEEIGLLAEIGIAVLLFVVGLRLDPALVRSIGWVSLITGLGQVAATFAIGFGAVLLLGLPMVPALYVALALTFSSTIIIVKLLSDKREIDALHGRIALGVLIVQDIVVVLAMIGLTAFGAQQPTAGFGAEVLWVLGKGAALLGGVYLLGHFVLPRLTRRMASSQELLMIFAVAWAVALAAFGDALGFSKEVGAFLAGISLAATPYRVAIGARLASLRDFLLLFFFIRLGFELDVGLLGAQILPAIVLSVFVLLGKPLIIMAILGKMGYRKRTSFLAGASMAQISEFSLILGALGVSLGQLRPADMGLITLVGLVTIGLSTYAILYSHPMFDRLGKYLGLFERDMPHHPEDSVGEDGQRPEVLLFGLGRYGSGIAEALRARNVRVLGVDFDPNATAHWAAHGLHAIYGDAEDMELAATLPLADARWVVSAIPDRRINVTLIAALRQAGYTGKVALTAHSRGEVEALRKAGADHVLLPFVDAAKEAADMLTTKG